MFLTKQQHQWMKNVVLPLPSAHAITTGQFSAVFSRAFLYCIAFRWKSSALHCQSFIPEHCHSSYSNTAFQLWQQESMYALTQCIIQRSSLSQRGKNSLQQFCTNKQQKFLKLSSRFLMWCCVSSLFMSHVQFSKQKLCRDVKDVWKAEQVRKKLVKDWFNAFYLSISISTWRAVTPLSTEEWMFPSAAHVTPPGWHHPHCALLDFPAAAPLISSHHPSPL